MPQAPSVFSEFEENQRQWLIRVGVACGGRLVRFKDSCWTEYPDGNGGFSVAFPRFEAETLAEDLDSFTSMMWRPLPNRSVIVWIGDPPSPASLDVRLMAFGFRSCWRPQWMRLDLAGIIDQPLPAGVSITSSLAPDAAWPPALDALGERTTTRLARKSPDRAIEFTAWLEGRRVGVGAVYLQRGRDAIAGIYDVGVDEEFRNRGIGGALTAAACRAARDRGYRWAGLNATDLGKPVYRKLGFVSEGNGQTVELTNSMLAGPRPSTRRVAFAEAIGLGGLESLNEEFSTCRRAELEAKLACNLTPFQLAVRFNQPGVAMWLRRKGALPDLMSAWDIGWVEHVRARVRRRPESLNRPRGRRGATFLHEAGYRGDVPLIQLLLDAGADPTIRDASFGGTPANWAEHAGHLAAAELLRSARNET